ncbi:MAG TPA: nucleoside triphosphate pyrophosphohydrolase [Dongiaceae bacterium]|jgi:ATP diphosphatase|nr:nucleoside triphosphate pyrophosphohydrolase [Dongiaceae bacterium]
MNDKITRYEKAGAALEELLGIMARLRDPRSGCPWDLEQDFASIAPHTLEEAYEVADAIARNDREGLKEELGDLLFQIVFYAQMAHEVDQFDFADIVQAISAKMIARHPHVFGTAEIRSAEEQTRAWEEDKARKRQAGGAVSALDGVTLGLPALLRAEKLQKRAARIGFDWPEIAPVFAKVTEELSEVKEAATPETRAEEIGDLLFACVNLARHFSVDAEAALRTANAKFERRFRRMEQQVRQNGLEPGTAGLATLDAVWNQVKQEETESSR